MDDEEHINLVPITTQPAVTETLPRNLFTPSLPSNSTKGFFHRDPRHLL